MMKIYSPVQFLALLIFVAASTITDAGAQPYVNGNLITGTTSSNGTAAPAGFSWSEVQAPNTTLGFSVNISAGLSAIDDFTVPLGQIWNLSSFTGFAYSTGFSNPFPPFNDLRVQIFSSDPTGGTATPIFGDLTTNRFTASTPAQIYRIGATPGTTRLVYANTANISLTLNPGHYWIEWQVGTITGITSNFSPPSTVLGTTTQPGNNAWQHNTSTNVYSVLADGGSGQRQDFPFVLNYSVTTPPACSGAPNPGNTLSTASRVCSGQSFILSLQNNPLASGLTYQWQSSPDGLNWSDIPGSNSFADTTSQNADTYYRANVFCGTDSSYSGTLLVPMYTSFFASQPANASAACGSIAQITSLIGGSSPVLGFQWQQRQSVASPWVNVTNSETIAGANDDSLQFMQLPSTLDGYQFRLLYLDTCGNLHISDSAFLTVTPFTASVTPTAASVCAGQATQLNIGGNTTHVTSIASPVQSLTIPDTVKAGVIDSLLVSAIPAGAVISALSVKLNIAHTWAGDLAISLKAPNGRIINLDYYMTATGGPGATTGLANTVIGSNGSVFLADSSDPWTGYFTADRAITADGATFPSGPASLLANTTRWDSLWLVPNGTWKLGLYDGFTGDVGTLVSWVLEFTYSAPAKATWTGSIPGTLFTDASATTPYTAGSQVSTVFVNPASTATYTATPVSQTCGSGSASVATVSIGTPIGTISGIADVSTCAGNPATFSITVSSGSDLSYQWQVSSDGGVTWANIPGANAISYTIPAVSGADNNNKYRAVVSNPCNANPVNSAAATLTVGAGPIFNLQPANTTGCVGAAATFSVTVAGPASTFQWQQSIDGGATWSDITSGGNSSTYTISGLTPADNNNRYRVQVTDCGITTASSAAILTVVAAATISSQPASITACEGSDVTFTAVASGSGYQWQVSTDGGVTWTNISGAATTILNLTAVTATVNNNIYRLAVQSCGSTFIYSNNAALTVNSPAVISVQPAPVTACEGDNVSFSVTATGTSPDYQWQVSSDGGTTWSDITGANTASYGLSAVSLSAGNNRYRVWVGSADPCDPVLSNPALLTVNPIPSVGGTVSPSALVCSGSSITLSGTGATTYTWNNGANNGVPFAISSTTTFTVTGNSNGCTATSTVTVTVNPNPAVTIMTSAGTALLPGSSTILTANSTPVASSYRWFHNGTVIAGATGNSYTVTYTSQADLGGYAAEATDGNGCKGNSGEIQITAANVALVSPNPSGIGYFMLNVPAAGGTGLNRFVNMFDSKGALVFSQRFRNAGSPMKVDTRSLPQGIYCVEITDINGNRIMTSKVMVSGH